MTASVRFFLSYNKQKATQIRRYKETALQASHCVLHDIFVDRRDLDRLAMLFVFEVLGGGGLL